MEMNLQMFAENTQTTAGLSAEMKTYYGMELLENAKPQLVHNQFAATKGLPAGGGKTVEWRKFGAFDKALKPLTEGVTPDGSGISVSYITKELAQYGDYTTVSDMLDLTAIDDVVLEITDRHGSNMGLTLDTVTRNEIQQGKQVIYAPKIGSDGTKTVTSADLRYRVSANSGTEDGTEPEPGTPAWQQLVDAFAGNKSVPNYAQ